MAIKSLLATRMMIAGLACALVGTPLSAMAAQEQQGSPAQNQPAEPTPSPNSNGEAGKTDGSQTNNTIEPIPDSPGSSRAQSNQETQSNPTATPPATQPAPQQGPQPTPARPLGTAAAEPLTPGGVAASQPAGAAIAPAKQKRSHSLLIKVGVVVAASAAVGTVVALSTATSSKPPGSR